MDSIISLVNSPAFWMILGCALVGAEVVTPGFILMFFGLSAFTVSGLVYAVKPDGLLWPALAFAVLSVVYLVSLRKLCKRIFAGRREKAQEAFDNFTGQHATVLKAIAPGAVGKVEFHGTQWDATSDTHCPEGSRVTIVRKESLTLIVKPII